MTTRAYSNDLGEVWTPGKMLEPTLSSWVKQVLGFSSCQIDRRDLGMFVPITAEATPSKVIECGLSTKNTRDDVFNGKTFSSKGFRATAIFTVILRPRRYNSLNRF
jgi:hypothetical protein